MEMKTPEEMKKLLEKAEKELREKLEKMTPEERAQAAEKAKQFIAQDSASMQTMLEEAKKIAFGTDRKG